jgi:hypothetical protein
VRRAANRDISEPAIVTALREAGATVHPIDSTGCPDLLVGYRGETYLLECKVASSTGRTKRKTSGGVRPDERGLTPAQQAWWAAWTGRLPVIVRTPLEALVAIGALGPR